MAQILLLFLTWTLISCATPAPQTEVLLGRHLSFSEMQQIENVPFIQQTAGHCGPATLAMVMNWAGKKISADDLAAQVYTPGMKGSLQQDMITAARREGFLAVPIYGLNSLLTEIQAGHPVIVFENLALTWVPQYHYAVVLGYDLRKQEVIMHSGPEPFKHWDLRKFERSWMLTDYWGLVVLPPGQLLATGSELDHVKAAASLEQIGQSAEAAEIYEQILKRWPDSLGADIGMANIAYAAGNYAESVRYLSHATHLHPEVAGAWYNLTLAQAAAHQNQEAHQSALVALRLVSVEQRDFYSENLKQWIETK